MKMHVKWSRSFALGNLTATVFLIRGRKIYDDNFTKEGISCRNNNVKLIYDLL